MYATCTLECRTLECRTLEYRTLEYRTLGCGVVCVEYNMLAFAGKKFEASLVCSTEPTDGVNMGTALVAGAAVQVC